MADPFLSSVVSTFPTNSGNANINPLLVFGFRWGLGGAGAPATVTYSFPTYGSPWHSDYATYLDNEPFNGFTPFSAAQQTAAVAALDTWAEVANITFQQVNDVPGDTDVGDIRFGNSASVTQSTAAAWAYFPYDGFDSFEYPESGDVWFDASYAPNLQLNPGQFGFSTLVHEIGHAIGLDHPFADAPGELALPASLDNQRYTIMSYTLYGGSTIEAAGPMMFDILAAQYIYGANMTTRNGDTSYVFSNSTEELKCIWDAGGGDIFDVSNQAVAATIDLRAGAFSSIGRKNNGAAAVGNIGIAYNVTIEDAFGTQFNDKITGNEAHNRLRGWFGNDTIDGAAGNDFIDGGVGSDTMVGGVGDDYYMVDNVGDKVSETTTNANGGGTDTVEAYVSFSLAASANVDVLYLFGSAALNGTGNAQDNLIYGNEFNNILDGGGGADFLRGGAGNDTYIIDNLNDLVNEEGNTDTGDVIITSVLYAGPAGGADNISYTGSGNWTYSGDGGDNVLSGGSGNDTLNGQQGNDTVLGNGGNDILLGFLGDDYLDGGAGNDQLFGGAGNDTYVVNSVGDVIDEEGNTDTWDVVLASVSVNLATMTMGVEHAYLLGNAALNVTGNAASNQLIGNSAANTLDGGGGADNLIGGGGSDTYIVDNTLDEVVEVTAGAAGGTDLVQSSVSYSLASRANVENLMLTGVLAINATGNTLNNVLTGNGAANVLDGGTGSDTLTGGLGDDTYVVDSAGDVVNEVTGAGGGTDTIESSIALTLSWRPNIENLTLTGVAAIDGEGNASSNTIRGNAMANSLDGGGGADTLKGGAGNDTYVIDNVGDVIDEEGNTDAWDVVLASVSVNLATMTMGVEHAYLLGNAALNVTGNAASNQLIGNSAANTLDGGGGADNLIGGGGSDTYIVDNTLDEVVEVTAGAAGGTDLVQSSVSYSLASRANVENLMLTGVLAINATGNTLNNVLTGNGAANVLDGGTGSDTLTGGLGDDTYVVDSAGDVVNEVTGAGGGTDTIESSIALTLSWRPNIENLTLTGVAAIDGEGNASSNTIRGNAMANSLDGGGGADTLKGGAGNDTYVIDNVGDVIDEEGNTDAWDVVLASVSVNLATMTMGVEHAYLLGNAALNVTGNAASNQLIGNSAANTLDGGGGADNLIGGGGSDTFDYNHMADAGDSIVDFVLGAAGDILDLADLLDDIGYGGADPFTDAILAFTAAGSNTLVSVDADGAGAGAAITLATLTNVTLSQANTENYFV